jgi:hypothetical protein
MVANPCCHSAQYCNTFLQRASPWKAGAGLALHKGSFLQSLREGYSVFWVRLGRAFSIACFLLAGLSEGAGVGLLRECGRLALVNLCHTTFWSLLFLCENFVIIYPENIPGTAEIVTLHSV